MSTLEGVRESELFHLDILITTYLLNTTQIKKFTSYVFFEKTFSINKGQNRRWLHA